MWPKADHIQYATALFTRMAVDRSVRSEFVTDILEEICTPVPDAALVPLIRQAATAHLDRDRRCDDRLRAILERTALK
ncbi:hypothetical protein [Actinoplanes sp. HUAS TT8]|uniref:hypothetical protein n=1 Tax=Actinoplanes sp. HUAS TT8 TaxID=3447453 RepID=UPI003F52884B